MRFDKFISVSTMLLAAALLLFTIVVCPRSQAQGDRVEANLRLGAEAMHRGNAAEAEKFFREVIQLAPQLADGYLDLGLAELKQGKLAEAVDSFQTALQRNPKTPGASMFLGIAHFQMNHLDQARAALIQ